MVVYTATFADGTQLGLLLGLIPAANAWMMQTVYSFHILQGPRLSQGENLSHVEGNGLFWNAHIRISRQLGSSPSYSPEHKPISIGTL